MFAMFLSTMPQTETPMWQDIRDFVRRRDSTLPNDAPRIYLYHNTSVIGRIVPWCAISELFTTRQPVALSEITWPPLGIVFGEGTHDRLATMAEITAWGRYQFHEKTNSVLSLPKLHVNTDHPLAFGTVGEIEEWRKSCGVMWAVAKTDDLVRQTSVGLTIKKTS